MRSDSYTHHDAVVEAPEAPEFPEASIPLQAPAPPEHALPNPKSEPRNGPSEAAQIRNPKFLPPTPAQRLDDLAQIIRAYNAVTENLQHSHESLQAEVVRLQEKLASTDAQLQRSRRLAALGEMAAGIAHEIRNPLGAIQLYAGLIVDDLQIADREGAYQAPMATFAGTADTARKIVAAVRGLNAIVSDVLSFARDVAPRPQPVPVAHIFDRAIESHRPAIAAATVAIDRADHRHVDEQDHLLINADPELLHQAVLNMVRNAVEAMTASESQNSQLSTSVPQINPEPEIQIRKAKARGSKSKNAKNDQPQIAKFAATAGLARLAAGKADLRTANASLQPKGSRGDGGQSAINCPLLTLDARREGSMIVLVIRDTGPGIAQQDIDRIFNPFFTTRNTGTGLGLAIVHRIVDAHGGSIAVHNDHGAVFEVRLPAADRQPSPQAIPTQASPSRTAVSNQVAA